MGKIGNFAANFSGSSVRLTIREPPFKCPDSNELGEPRREQFCRERGVALIFMDCMLEICNLCVLVVGVYIYY